MNKKVAWIIGIIILVIVIIVFMMTKGKVTDQPTTTDDQVQGSSVEGQSFKELLTSKNNVKCEFSDTIASSTSFHGTAYVSNGKMRGDFTTSTAGKEMTGHMIMAENTMNVWIDGMTTGFKMSLDTMTTSGNTQTSAQAVDTNKKMNYQCNSWSPDGAVFTLPTGVTFTDMSAMMGNQGMDAKAGASVSGSASQCASCDSAPEAYRAQCRAALKCK